MISTSKEGFRQAWKCNRQALKLTDRPVARWMNLGSVTRIGNSCKNISNMLEISPTHPDRPGNLQPTLTDLVNIVPYSQKYIVTDMPAPVEQLHYKSGSCLGICHLLIKPQLLAIVQCHTSIYNMVYNFQRCGFLLQVCSLLRSCG